MYFRKNTDNIPCEEVCEITSVLPKDNPFSYNMLQIALFGLEPDDFLKKNLLANQSVISLSVRNYFTQNHFLEKFVNIERLIDAFN